MAAQVAGPGRYVCPVCKAMVSHRSGTKRTPHFAHWPGLGSPECENFVPSHHEPHAQVKFFDTTIYRRMELRLLVTTGGGSAVWSLELVLPPCRKCEATVSLDVGGRIQTLDMRGMEQYRRVTAELSVEPYRIVSFSGEPDPLFVDGIERECQGLPSSGAAAFSVSRSGELKGYPRAKKLRKSETIALLWREPEDPGFPSELTMDSLSGRQGWNLGIVTIPDNPSPECIEWIQSFTKLSIVPRAPALIPVWPFFSRSTSVNEINCARAGMVLMSAEMFPVDQGRTGPLIYAQSVSAKLPAFGVERSPAFFALKPGDNDVVRVVEESARGLNKFITLSLRAEIPKAHPVVELAFEAPGGGVCVVSLHQRECAELAAKVRMQEARLEYLSMPDGAIGLLRIDGPTWQSESQLCAGDETAPHRQDMRLLSPDVLAQLVSALAEPMCQIEIEFGGFGRLRLSNSLTASRSRNKLSPALRFRLLGFMLQFQSATPEAVFVDDAELVKAFAVAKPATRLIPHYRSLVKQVADSGFELKLSGGSTAL